MATGLVADGRQSTFNCFDGLGIKVLMDFLVE
jgi:hypothetical protein